MPSRRPLILMCTLLALMLGYGYRTYWYPYHGGGMIRPTPPLAPLAGKNAISGLKVSQNASGTWMADFDYFYTGEAEPQYVSLQLELMPPVVSSVGPASSPLRTTFIPPAQRGLHHVSVAINYPGSEGSTRQVSVRLRIPGSGAVLADQQVDQIIDWPNWQNWHRNQEMAQHTVEENLNRAVEYIDTDSAPQLAEAKLILERLISQNAQFDPAYVELARVAMRSNWGQQGLHESETLLSSALQIRPDSVNAKILLGYVYVHQKHFAKADALFAEAAQSNPQNLWLWANWGESLAAQGKPDQATVKYREAITRPMTHGTYDRARTHAYAYLLDSLRQRKDLDGMEVLYKQQVAEFGPGSCYTKDYARFLLLERGDTQGAIDLSRRALNQNCEDSPSRQMLGLAEYVKWSSASGAERTEALNEARIYLPTGPMPLYLLSAHEKTFPAAKQLVAAGEPIDQRDNDKLTALAYALQNRDLAAARRLLSLGARWDVPVGYADVPAGLIPVIDVNVDAIRLLQKSGADYAKLRYRGVTAYEVAKESGNSVLLEALGRKAATL